MIASKNKRLQKLKSLEKKIKVEIKICQNDINLFVNKDLQYTLNF